MLNVKFGIDDRIRNKSNKETIPLDLEFWKQFLVGTGFQCPILLYGPQCSFIAAVNVVHTITNPWNASELVALLFVAICKNG